MVSPETIQQSNARVAALPRGLVALFIGASSGIGQAVLERFAQYAPAPRIYTVARAPTVASHEALLASLRQSHPSGTYNLIEADVSLVSEIDKVVRAITQTEIHLDILFLSAGFMAFEGRRDTREGLDPSMTTRYHSRLRAVQLLLPLLNSPAAVSPRVVSVLAAGMEGPINEHDLDLREPGSWSFWNASVYAATMSTLALEHLARQNPRLSVVHWSPGPVATPGLARAAQFGMSPPNQASQDEAGVRGLFIATSDRYAVGDGGLVPVPPGLGVAKKSGGGIFLVGPQGENVDNERLLGGMRSRGLDEKVWSFTQTVFAACAAQAAGT
ncbi:Dehydrogenase/reductase SDR family member 12 [Pleurostoma richardsiae]|uniref:Dehydrogenase/reductase SDR family member 12 n=1 Tax=Pleurostoma richardsiae TaxID=41990 RepID=A0AA38VH26_9PEZI|nr:Dehydrogenase/reductase SDR family member 12 [Pleurostoma richardsiae]